ncbi:SDR family NAD(P)-dependent oxidoreductase [Falsiroseomonas sp. HW251]|uniref:SDR family NAD(P)-dependent oxidoreductase n=1 Tax=Falsiroseomonas sp. HW251 TaxID=3390998 RepID=UPI003D31DF4D
MFALDLTGRAAIVTAGSRGIGAAACVALAKAGADVAINYKASEAEAQRVADAVRAEGRRALVLQGDVADSAAVTAMVAAAQREFGRLDIVVSNAGAGTRVPMHEITDDEYRRVFDINVKGFVALSRAALPAMREARAGRIIAVSSIVGRSGKAFMSPSPTYAGAKAALIGYVRGLAREVGGFGITVNAVCPGWVDWGSKHAAAPAEVRASAISQIPLGRTGTADDIANAIVFLASDQAAYLTGVSLDVNGGLYMA